MQESSAIAHGVFDRELGFDSHEWSCSHPVCAGLAAGQRVRAVSQGAVLVVMAACRRYNDSADTCEAGCRVLWNLAMPGLCL